MGDALASMTLAQLGTDSARRIAALLAAQDVAPDADIVDRFRVANYILTGSAEFPDQEESQRIEVRRLNESYPDETEPVPPEGPDGDGILDRLADEVEPAPSAGQGWKGRLG